MKFTNGKAFRMRHTRRPAVAYILLITLLLLAAPAAAQEPPPAEPPLVIDKTAPMGIFFFSSARFARGELDQYFDEMEGDFFSREQDTLSGVMQNLLYFAMSRASDFDVADPASYKRMNNKAKMEIYKRPVKAASQDKLDVPSLTRYSQQLDFRYILAGDLLKMKTWQMEEGSAGCEMSVAYYLFDEKERKIVTAGTFDLNEKVPEGGLPTDRKLRRLDANSVSFAKSPYGYCFFKFAELLIEKLEPPAPPATDAPAEGEAKTTQ